MTYLDESNNQILATFNNMNTFGSTAHYQQIVCRAKKNSLGKGITVIQYTLRAVIPNNVNPNEINQISPEIINEIKALPIDSYQF